MTKITNNASQAGRLSDAELERVSGGLNPQPLPPKELSRLFSASSLYRVLPSFSIPSFFRF